MEIKTEDLQRIYELTKHVQEVNSRMLYDAQYDLHLVHCDAKNIVDLCKRLPDGLLELLKKELGDDLFYIRDNWKRMTAKAGKNEENYWRGRLEGIEGQIKRVCKTDRILD